MKMAQTDNRTDIISQDTLPQGFLERMQRLLGGEYAAFLESWQGTVHRGLRINTLKCPPEHFKKIFPAKDSLRPIPFSSVGFEVDGGWKAGMDPLHHAGAYYMQEPSAMSAVTVLAPQPGERILDMCGAPGGKSTQIAAAMQGKGLLWANEYVRPRAQILLQNLERCGVSQEVVSSCEAALLGERLPDYFDGVLVDAPCSGEGMFRKEAAALEMWSEDNIRLCAGRQREILDAAARTVAPGGRLVYSTCTFAPEEDECMAAWFLQHHPEFSLVDLRRQVSFGREGFGWEQIKFFAEDVEEPAASLEGCRRIFPSDGGEGHFIAAFRRQGSLESRMDSFTAAKVGKADNYAAACAALFTSCFDLSAPPESQFLTIGETVRLLPACYPSVKGLGVLGAGVAAAQICKNRLEPCHGLFMAAHPGNCRQLLHLSLEDERVRRFLRGEEIEASGVQGWTAVAVEGIITGFGKASGGRLKNRYPKGLRLMG